MNNYIYVFISGRGTTLDALIKGCISSEVVHVYSSDPNAKGLHIATDAGISTSSAIDGQLPRLNQLIAGVGILPRMIVLAGYMKILSPEFISRAEELGISIINIHPSLLPDYKGLNTYQRVLDDGGDVHGCTIHYVVDELDSGEVIEQVEIDVKFGDTVETLQARVQGCERILYPAIVDRLMQEDI